MKLLALKKKDGRFGPYETNVSSIELMQKGLFPLFKYKVYNIAIPLKEVIIPDINYRAIYSPLQSLEIYYNCADSKAFNSCKMSSPTGCAFIMNGAEDLIKDINEQWDSLNLFSTPLAFDRLLTVITELDILATNSKVEGQFRTKLEVFKLLFKEDITESCNSQKKLAEQIKNVVLTGVHKKVNEILTINDKIAIIQFLDKSSKPIIFEQQIKEALVPILLDNLETVYIGRHQKLIRSFNEPFIGTLADPSGPTYFFEGRIMENRPYNLLVLSGLRHYIPHPVRTDPFSNSNSLSKANQLAIFIEALKKLTKLTSMRLADDNSSLVVDLEDHGTVELLEALYHCKYLTEDTAKTVLFSRIESFTTNEKYTGINQQRDVIDKNSKTRINIMTAGFSCRHFSNQARSGYRPENLPSSIKDLCGSLGLVLSLINNVEEVSNQIYIKLAEAYREVESIIYKFFNSLQGTSKLCQLTFACKQVGLISPSFYAIEEQNKIKIDYIDSIASSEKSVKQPDPPTLSHKLIANLSKDILQKLVDEKKIFLSVDRKTVIEGLQHLPNFLIYIYLKSRMMSNSFYNWKSESPAIVYGMELFIKDTIKYNNHPQDTTNLSILYIDSLENIDNITTLETTHG